MQAWTGTQSGFWLILCTEHQLVVLQQLTSLEMTDTKATLGLALTTPHPTYLYTHTHTLTLRAWSGFTVVHTDIQALYSY